MDVDVAIVGGGLAGASLAVALRASRLKVALIEARPPVKPVTLDQRVYAFSPASQRFLDGLGIWKHVDQTRVCPVEAMEISGDRDGRLRFSAYEAGLSELAWIIESWTIHTELWEFLKRQSNLTLLCPKSCVAMSIDAHARKLHLSDGTVISAKLVVGADGFNSWVRQQSGIEALTTSYEESGVVANLGCSGRHGGIARQWFLSDGILALLPMADNLVSMVWSATQPHADYLLSLDERAFCALVRQASDASVGDLQLVSDRAAFPLRLMRVKNNACSRLVLIGDAAHAIHPLSGHGVNLGFEDARVLGNILSQLKPWEDPGEVGILRRYVRSRAEEPLLMQAVTHALNRLFKNRGLAMIRLRNDGMKLTDSLPVVKNALIRYAAYGRF